MTTPAPGGSAPEHRSLRGRHRVHAATELAQRFRTNPVPIQDLATALGRRPSMVRRLLEEAGVHTQDPFWLGLPADELATAVAARYAAGGSIEAISRDTGLDRRRLNDLVHQHNIPIRTRRPLPAEQIPWVITQYQHGATLRALAQRTGRSHSTIRRTLLTAGITPRDRNHGRTKPPTRTQVIHP